MDAPPLSRREPILDLFWHVWGYEILTDSGVILGDREFIFDNLSEFLDILLFEIHTEYAEELKDTYIFVNIRPTTFILFADRIRRLVKPNLVIEIREDRTDARILESIGEVKEKLGVKLCIDDFGTGSSNIERLILLRPDFVKVDMRVLSPLPYACRKSALKNLASLIYETTRAQVILEKVENPEDLDIAAEIGISLWQGFLHLKKSR